MRSGTEGVRIQPSQGAEIFISSRYALDVVLSAKTIAELPTQVARRNADGCGPLLAALLPGSLASEVILSSRLECLTVGVDSMIRDEVASIRLRFPDESAEGSAQEILRVRHVGDDRTFRSEVFARTGNRQDEARLACPAVAIFDGATSLLRWGALWPEASRIILLDRADPRLKDATEEIDRIFVTRPGNIDLPLAPPGTDAVAFRGAS
jgi:hypothetical protein